MRGGHWLLFNGMQHFDLEEQIRTAGSAPRHRLDWLPHHSPYASSCPSGPLIPGPRDVVDGGGGITRTNLSLLVLLAGSIVFELRYALCYEFGGFVRVQGLLRLAVFFAGGAGRRGRWRWAGVIVDVVPVDSGRFIVGMADWDVCSGCKRRRGCHCAEVRGTQVLGTLGATAMSGLSCVVPVECLVGHWQAVLPDGVASRCRLV